LRGVSRGGKLLGILPLLVCPLLLAGSAQGATLTLGSQFQGTIEPADSSTHPSVLQTALPAPLITGSPVDGTVIDWRFAGIGNGFVPRIFRLAGPDLFVGAGTGPPQVGTGAVAGPFPLSMPIKRGDYFGFDVPVGSVGTYATPGSTYQLFTPALADGSAGRAPNTTINGREIAIAATVRYCLVPKLKGKKPAAAHKALAASDCAVGKTKKAKKRRKRKSVLSQSVAPGTSISDTQPVDLKVSRKR
jgi:PASTA domain